MIALNPITALRLKRAKHRRAPMPVSQKPCRKKGETGGPSPYSVAGTLLYSFYEAGMRRKAQQVLTPEQLVDRQRTSTRRIRRSNNPVLVGRRTAQNPGGASMGTVQYAACDPAGSRAAERRKRQGAHLHQHPNVVARFANHPTPAQIEAAVAAVEAPAKAKRAPRKKAAAA